MRDLVERLVDICRELDSPAQETDQISETHGRVRTSIQSVADTLRKKVERFERLAEHFGSAPVPYLVTDRAGIVQEANRAALDMLNISEEYLLKRPFSMLVPGDSLDKFVAYFTQIRNRSGTREFDVDLSVRRLGRIPVRLVAAADHGKLWGPDCIRWQLYDLTGHRRAERALEESESRFRDLYENAPVGFFSVGTDRMIRICNNYGAGMLGYRPSELEGRDVLELYANGPMGAERAARIFERFNQGEPVHREELQMRHKSGKPVWVSLGLNQVRDDRGRVIASRSVVENISSQKEAQEILRRGRIADPPEPGRDPDFPGQAGMEDSQRVARIGNWSLELKNGSLRWSDQIFRMLGRDPGSHNPDFGFYTAMIHPEDRQRVVDKLYQALWQTGQFAIEHRLLPPDGSDQVVCLRGSTEFDGQGNPLRLAGTIQDITLHRTALDALRHTSELLERVFSGLNPVAILDSGFNFVRVNLAYAGQWTPADFVGRNLFDLLPNPDLQAGFEEVCKSGSARVGFEQPLSIPWQGQGAMTYWDWVLQPVTEPDGSVSGLVQILVEKTEKKRVESERDLLYAAVESSADAVVISDSSGLLRYVNPAFEQVSGYDREEVLGSAYQILGSGRNDSRTYQAILESLKEGRSWKGRLENQKKDGTRYQEDCTLSPVKDAAGQTVNFIAIKRDVTEQLQLESIAWAVESMKNVGYILSGIRHEIGNPINSIRAALRLVQARLEGPGQERVHSYVSRAMDESARLATLLDSLKSFNMYDRLDREELDLKGFLSSLSSLVDLDFRRMGVAFSTSIQPGAERCYADRRALQQVMLNVLTNACDSGAGRSDCQVALRATRQARRVRIRIQDTGSGMSRDHLNQIFRPFFTTKPGGTGLGLVIARKMMAGMGGEINVQSELNQGTIVDIFVPIELQG